MVYVDNVVEAIAHALDAPVNLSGSAFLITDPDQISLNEFYDYFGRAVGRPVRLRPDWRQPHGDRMIPFLDLKAQYKSIKDEVDRAVLSVLESSQFVLGPEVAAFEEEFAAFSGVSTASP